MRLPKLIGMWQLLAVVIAAITYTGGKWLPHFLVTLLITNLIAASIHTLVVLFLKSPWGERFPKPLRYLTIGMLVAAGTAVGIGLSMGVLRLIMGEAFLRGVKLGLLFRFSLVIAVVMTGLILLLTSMAKEIEERAAENERLKHLQLLSEMKALQARLNPHFLFNTLNTLLSLVRSRPQEAEEVILKMAELYRRVLRPPEQGTVALRDEVAMVRSYLEIEKVRMGERLNFSLEGEPEALDTMVPPLLVQPLVENAVLHGIGPLPEGGAVRLTADRRDGLTVITVSDSGAGFSEGRGSEGFGLESVSERMRLLYGSRGAMRIKLPPSGGTTIELEIPDAADGPDRRG